MNTLSDRCIEAMARAEFEAEWSDEWDRASVVRKSGFIDRAEKHFIALLSELDAAGFGVKPLVATDEMIAAVRRLDWTSPTDIDWPDGYAAMIAAAPDPFKAEDAA